MPDSHKTEADTRTRANSAAAITAKLLELFGSIPVSRELHSPTPDERATAIIKSACIKAAATSATLTLPAGPLGLLTIIPELAVIWQIQRQMVSDIASVYGKTSSLTNESMAYCLFKQGLSVTLSALVVKVGQKYLVRHASTQFMQKILQKVGISMTEKLLSRSITRFLPGVGAALMGTVSYRDTLRVGRSARDFFSSDIIFLEGVANAPEPQHSLPKPKTDAAELPHDADMKP